MRPALLALPALAAQLQLAQPSPPDSERWAWRYRRDVILEAGAEATLGELHLSPEVVARCQPRLEDVRLVGADGGEVAYVVDRAVGREAATSYAGRLIDARREAERESVWVVDLGEPRTFDRLDLDVPQRDFAKGLRVEVSDDRRSWRTAVEDVGIFDRVWTTRIHHASVDVPDGTRARYVKLTADDRFSRPVDVTGLAATAARPLVAERWHRPVELSGPVTANGVSRYRLAVLPGLPVEALRFRADDPVFSRRTVVREIRDLNGRRSEEVLADGPLYRVRIEDPLLSAALLELPLRGSQGGELVLEIHDGDSRPLRGLEVSAEGGVSRLIFTAGEAPAVLYYGNPATRAPQYDVSRVENRLALASRYLRAELGAERVNAHFRTPPPFTFVPALGSRVEAAEWRSVRRLSTPDQEDLFTWTLAPEDLGRLRPDLGDLRIVDDTGRQVPYVLEPSVAEARVVLTSARDGSASARHTRHRLLPPEDAGVASPLPVAALELRFAEAFFDRPARLLMAPVARRGRDRILYSGTLTRAGPAEAAGDALEGGILVIPLSGARVGALVLDVDDGDNAPLTLLEARAVVPVPRVAFKSGSGAHRLLLGNPDADPPRYDIAALRQEVLAYSAVPIQAAPAEPNPAFRGGPRSGRLAPPGAVLWGTLLAAVVALLLLTARIVRASPE